MGGMIPRDPAGAASVKYDVIIVGGGVYGVMAVLEAARRRLRPLLLERADFGGATSWNSLRIVHGGLRYLQHFDLRRFRESVAERQWFLQNFPDLVRPLECLMPLYGRGLRRPSVFRLALRLNDRLSARRNRGVRPSHYLSDGRLLSVEETESAFPGVDRAGLLGGALWQDAVMVSSERVLVEALRWAVSYGAVALNYVEAGTVETGSDGAAAAVLAVDRRTGERHRYAAPVVLNCAGPWSRLVATRLDPAVGDRPELFQPALAFNVFLDRAPLAPMALAVAPREPGGRTYFVQPWQERVLAGTFHAPWTAPWPGPDDPEVVARGHLTELLSDLNAAVPGWDLRPADVLRVHAGVLPASAGGSEEPAARPVILEHRTVGGIPGVISVSGVKFTTARSVAEQALRTAFPRLSRDPEALLGTERPIPSPVPSLAELTDLRRNDPAGAARLLAGLVAREAVVEPDDLLLRRTDWGQDPAAADQLAAEVARLLAADRV